MNTYLYLVHLYLGRTYGSQPEWVPVMLGAVQTDGDPATEVNSLEADEDVGRGGKGEEM